MSIMIGIKLVQDRLPEYWTNQSYPTNFETKPLPHRHFNHALTHAMKAVGKLAALSDAYDHERMFGGDIEAQGYKDEAPKVLADLVICAARMSQQIGVDLDEAVQKRINTLIERWGGH